MSKIVVLNSGGFDSVVLAHMIAYENPDMEIFSLHFRYGERNQEEQQKSVDHVCDKLGIHNKTITIPPIDWTSRDFYGDSNEYTSQYLEYRNLIFLAYALSYAESIGAEKIYLATLKGLSYPDTSDIFFEGINSFSKPLTNIEVCTPFSEFHKNDLIYYANKYLVEQGEYFSCDTPVNGHPCGECADCKDIAHIEEVRKIDHPHKALVMNGYDYEDPEFIRLTKAEKVKEVRLLINNDCQLKCKHCFYGFEETKAPILSNEELYDVIRQADALGLENVHFSGKEPLFDDKILIFAEKMQKDGLNITFDVVTNGINIPKYARQLKEFGLKKFYLSVDDVQDASGIRSVKGVTDKALRVCTEERIDVEIFIDLHANNYNKVTSIVMYLVENYPCISAFYIRTIRNIGNASDMTVLPLKCIDEAYLEVLECAKRYTDKKFNMNIGIEYESVIYSGEPSHIATILEAQDFCFTQTVLDNFTMTLEDRCYRYEFQITITPDGYALGCGSEVAFSDYDKISVGNIREHTLKDLIALGKHNVTGICNSKYCNNNCKKCSFLE